MPLTLRLDGETIAEIDEQVTRVALQTGRGEAGALGVGPSDGVVDIIVDRVPAGGPPRLDQIEDAERRATQERQPEGTKVGYRDAERPRPVSVGQGFHDETLRPGGVDKEASARSIVGPPTKDLFAGLDPSDTDGRTARIEAYDKCGDVDEAIKTASQGEAPTTDETNQGDNSTADESSPDPTPDGNSDPDAENREFTLGQTGTGYKKPGKKS